MHERPTPVGVDRSMIALGRTLIVLAQYVSTKSS